jgi:hypothetical protein
VTRVVSAGSSPSKVPAQPARAPAGSLPRALPPMRSAAPKPCLRVDDEAHRVASRACRFGISPGRPAAVHSPSPDACASGSGSGALNVLFGVRRLLPAPRSREERLPWGSCALITTSADRVHTRTECPLRASVRPRRFSRPRRFTPRSAWRVCFAPQPCPGFSLQGFLPPPEPYAVIPRRCPRVVASRRLRLPAPASRSSTPGPCSPVGVRWSSRRRETPGSSAPLMGFSSSGLLSPHRGRTPSRPLRLRRFPR